jgi:hypothetical protein
MPGFVRSTLVDAGLMQAYKQRPAYQRNDYIGWIVRAKRGVTQRRRLTQMLQELRRGDVYMRMKWKPRA